MSSLKERRKTASPRSSKKLARVEVINGPNLNLLGRREPEIYGKETLERINEQIGILAADLGVEADFFQSNHEGALIDRIQNEGGRADLIIINPGAYTHTSIALRDALVAAGTPAVEVHLTNTQAREPFRALSYIAPVVVGRIEGLGPQGYLLALTFAATHVARD